MNKVTAVIAASVCAVSLFGAAEEPEEEVKKGLVQQMHDIFEAGFDVDFFSTYVWRSAVQNDEPVIEPCVWADLTYFNPFWLGFSIWQNYDLTPRRHSVLMGGLTETDYNVHVGATAWESDGETMFLDVEVGHEWYVNQRVRGENDDLKNTSELYAKVTFKNEIANVYGQASWMYDDFGSYRQSFYYELGLKREFDLLAPLELPEETLLFGLDWNLGFGDSRYLYYLYGGVDRSTDEFGEETYSNPTAGVGGTTVKAYLTWNITEWMSLVGTIAYTGVLNGSARQALGDAGTGWQGDPYRRDLLWGGLSLKFKF